ncbi:MAG TPA: outer membrane beta-barrel protein [Polyangiaceae bacterium]|nr:outer membrane beta-barrel protein [Polyangiaceae bacterium]
MTRLEIACTCSLLAFAALSTSAAAAPKKKPTKPAATPAASAAPSAAAPSASAPAPAPASSATTSTSTSDDEETGHAEAAPSSGDKKITVGADVLFVLPVGNLSDDTGPQIGPLLRGGYRIMPQLELTARIGYLFAFGKTQNPTPQYSASTSITDIPVWLGARYFLMDAPAGLYGAAEIGMNFLNASYTVNPGNVQKSTGDTRAGFNLGVGYVISKDLPIDLRLQYSYLNLVGSSGEGPLMGIGLSAGYSFFF